MTNIIEFLRARLDEDEQIARTCGDLRWSVKTTTHRERENEPPYPVAMVNPVFIDMYTPDGMTFDVAACQHTARWDPARVLAEVEAKRRILERAEFVGHHGPALDHVRAMDMTVGASAAFRDVLWLLALSYSDHPEYDATWTPTEVA